MTRAGRTRAAAAGEPLACARVASTARRQPSEGGRCRTDADGSGSAGRSRESRRARSALPWPELSTRHACGTSLAIIRSFADAEATLVCRKQAITRSDAESRISGHWNWSRRRADVLAGSTAREATPRASAGPACARSPRWRRRARCNEPRFSASDLRHNRPARRQMVS
jgi:hypothetical protein